MILNPSYLEDENVAGFPAPSILGLERFAPTSQLAAGLLTLLLSSVLVTVQPAVGHARVDHATRRRIVEHLQRLPGDHFRSIARTLRLGVGEARHHLNVLVRQRLVREDKSNGRCRYYAEDPQDGDERNQLFVKHWAYRDLRLRVLSVVRIAGVVSPTSVAVALGISRQLAGYHLARLQELGLVRREGRRYRV